ncbi:long-chain acyl-CoA synthetase [Streptomyces noursei ZPM]|uniref:Acyl-CoA synthetase n=1 Tax=Streptomyces noursei TaxID=1971 RepID=A0A059VYG0_STRNR|nr:acyl-CoA synthetase, long-chain fatty acid:CoA ligase [Streptomyces noursei]AKA04610.1 long-chain acyl-CoA synthetase [Streptomyces noursei ZPM]EPY92630.1 long-chain acyl-CoA synthetase [Streptomyces noursei CCRC 11814]EXU88672.1 long-chain fatty acid--CoA ligase [Streptomyces noursei PD-1]GCB91975.1 long-chain acyl-CoA synthetase [Streptomyces noursei]
MFNRPTAPPTAPVPSAVTAPRLTPPRTTLRDGTVREATVPPLAPPVRTGSLGDIPFANAAEDPDAAVLSRKQPDGTWRDVTAAEFAAEVRAVAKGLIAHGLRPGDRLAIMARTTYEWTLLDFAAWAAGLVTVPLYPTSSAHQAQWILHDSTARACAVEAVDEARLISQIRGRLPSLDHLWQFSTGAVAQLVDAGRDLPDEAVDERRATLTPHVLATLVYTSGTTGNPKGCALTHANFFAEVDNAIALLHPVFTSVSEEPAATLLFLPLSHVFGRMVAVGCLRARVRLGHAASIQTDELLADLAAFRPTFLLAIPYVLEKVFNTGRATAEKTGRAASFDRAARIARAYGEAVEAREHGTGPGPGVALKAARTLYDPLVYRRIRAALGGRVRHAICGGSPLGHRLAAFYSGAGIEVFEGYGLTETTAASTLTPPLRPRIGTVGWPLPGSAVRIADDGEVLLRGPHVFAGYWDGARNAVRPATDHDGWLATGDLGALDADGYLTLTGRKKEIIVTSGGKNVAPAPLEDRLRAHPLVGQCMVVGDDRPYVTALLTLDPDGLSHWRQMTKKRDVPLTELVRDERLLADLQTAVDDANQLVSRAESIRRFAVLAAEFSERTGHLTPSLKLRRAAVARDFSHEISRLYQRE